MRYLLVGLGNIGRKRRQLLGSKLAATVDPYVSEADFSNPLACPTGIFDAAVLAVPNAAKLALLEHFIGAGKHVLVEKPLLFADRKAAERIESLARSNNVIWYTSYNHRFEPLVEEVKRELQQGALGPIYYARLMYGNGTVRNVVGSWREAGFGVLEDLGSHLLDLAGWLLNCQGVEFRAWSLERHESTAFDHVVIGSNDGRVLLEASFLSWKNSFSIDIVGAAGSLHLRGLQKWGSVELRVRERVLPSGVPTERIKSAPGGGDLTWERDLDHFERLVQGHEGSSMENDWWISTTLRKLALGPAQA
jgi:predicted dehydrogenase